MLEIRKRDLLAITSFVIILVLLNMLGSYIVGQVFVHITVGIIVAAILFAILEGYRRTQKTNRANIDNVLRQTESLLSIFFTLKIDKPLPRTRDWAASPDFLEKISEIIIREKPNLVVEVSSGISTLISAYSLRKIGTGKVVALEHDQKYASISESLVLDHGLKDVATVIHAPLEEVEINNKKWLWYETKNLKLTSCIDMLIIDGPPVSVQPLARYPALPILYDFFRNGTLIILDDGARRDEQDIVKLWLAEFKNIQCQFLLIEKGAYLMRVLKDGDEGK